MIEVIFYYGSEVSFVRISRNDIRFATGSSGNKLAPIDGLRLSYSGVCREHPDLELNKEWKQEAIKRFKDKIKSLRTEDDKAQYIIEDLKKHGYVAKFKQKAGHRKEVIK